jgi:hypothetical protein
MHVTRRSHDQARTLDIGLPIHVARPPSFDQQRRTLHTRTQFKLARASDHALRYKEKRCNLAVWKEERRLISSWVREFPTGERQEWWSWVLSDDIHFFHTCGHLGQALSFHPTFQPFEKATRDHGLWTRKRNSEIATHWETWAPMGRSLLPFFRN